VKLCCSMRIFGVCFVQVSVSTIPSKVCFRVWTGQAIGGCELRHSVGIQLICRIV
jgi:hypothetical protein